MLTDATCATCKDNQCEIRKLCCDDAASSEKRTEIILPYPEVKTQ